MNLQNTVASLMSTDLITLKAEDKLLAAKEVFDEHKIHHIPVVAGVRLLGMLSKVDYLYFLKHYDPVNRERYLNDVRLRNYTVEEVMSKRIVTVAPGDPLRKALSYFAENTFHALPVEDNGRLVGMITTHDFIFRLLHPKQEAESTK